MKLCEVCSKPIPEDYQNLLCDEHYKLAAAEHERKKAIEAIATPPPAAVAPAAIASHTPIHGIADPNYRENPEAPDKEQWEANINMFAKQGVLLYKPTRTMYEFIKRWCMDRVTEHPQYPKFIWKPDIVDVGCGCGVGSNVLSQEANFVWGIDKNEKSIRFAKEAFSRVKNGIYYSSQVTFDQMDILSDTRDFMHFDVVVAIEIIEHIADDLGFLQRLVEKFDNGKTIYFISTPNRNNKSILKDHPRNPYHVREYTSEEYHALLSRFFGEVSFFNSAGAPIEGITTEHTPLLAMCSKAKKV